MTFADLVYFGVLATAVLFSSVVLLRQFLRGELAARRCTGRLHRTYAPRVGRRYERVTLRRTTGDVIVKAASRVRHLSPQ